MPDKHLSTQFDSELNGVSSKVMEMGGLVEAQIRLAIQSLSTFSVEAANQVTDTETRVNTMEVDIDRDLSSIIARRQPTARDLRLLIAISKTTANLERAGDEADKIARMVKSILHSGSARSLPSADLRLSADLASNQLRKALDSFARLDTAMAVGILKEDDIIDKEFDGFVRKLITYMMEDPRTISCLSPKRSNALGITQKILLKSLFTLSKVRMFGIPRWLKLSRQLSSFSRL
jgi:phosphate transport system protein